MNPLLAVAGAKALDKIDFNKVFAAIGGLLLIILLVIVIKKYRKKHKSESQQDAYLDSIGKDINSGNLSYSISWYEGKAVTLAKALDASFGSNGGLMGCDQQSVYEVMKELKTKDDVKQMEVSFGTRELNASWLKKKKPMLLKEAIQDLMTSKEHKKVNEILEDNGIDYSL
jgi:positive regulator of sigma E activity